MHLYLLQISVDLKNIIFQIINITLIFYGMLLIIYIIGSIKISGNIIKSIAPSQEDFKKSDLLYYLPTANLQILATAKVIITTDTQTTKSTAEIAELTLQTTIQTVPDTSQPFALKYCGFWFAKDTFKATLTASGLLDGINITADDRLSSIIAAIEEAPKTILSIDKGAGVAGDATVTTEIKEYTNTFFVSSLEIKNGKADCHWLINIDGKTTCDGSFYLHFEGIDTPGLESASGVTEKEGILTRPLCTKTMYLYRTIADRDADIASKTYNKSLLQYALIVPDASCVVTVKVNRSAFVSKVYGIKFTNGMVTENSIDKPSEIEGLISIPIKVAKAIISIPAQLIQFRIVNIKNQTSLEAEQQNLQKAQIDRKKNELALQAEIVKAKLEAQKTILTYDTDIAKIKLESEQGLLLAQQNLITEQKALLQARKELEDEIKKVKENK